VGLESIFGVVPAEFTAAIKNHPATLGGIGLSVNNLRYYEDS
jgi:hypothetical protein